MASNPMSRDLLLSSWSWHIEPTSRDLSYYTHAGRSMTPKSYLPSFKRLTENIYYHHPTDESFLPVQSSQHPPNLVILLTWGSAPTRAFAKYANYYTTLFPSSRVLVLTTSFTELSKQRVPALLPTVDPAIDIIRSTIAHSTNPRILVHCFSNGGCFKLMRLSSVYEQKTGQPLPMEGLVFDSSPGIGHLESSLKAFSYVLPKQTVLYYLSFMMILLYLLAWKVLSLFTLHGGDWTVRMYNKINDGQTLKQAPRLYVYSKEDELVAIEDVQKHILEAKQRGLDVEDVEFTGSGHVAHMQKYPERYWTTVLNFWEKHTANQLKFF